MGVESTQEQTPSRSTLEDELSKAAAAAWEDGLAMPFEQLERLLMQFGVGGSAQKLVHKSARLAQALGSMAEHVSDDDLREWWDSRPAKDEQDFWDWRCEAAQVFARMAPMLAGD